MSSNKPPTSRHRIFTIPQVRGFRLKRHLLRDEFCGTCAPLSIAEITRNVSGIQTQVSSQAHLAMRARSKGAKWLEEPTPQRINRALMEKEIVKTWCMRGTLHYISAGDLPLYLSGIGRGMASKELQWMARDGLEIGLLDSLLDTIVQALWDRPLTREDLASQVAARPGRMGAEARRWIEHSWGGVVKIAALRGLVCFGPDAGNEITFVALEKWLPDFKKISQKENTETFTALANVVERYLAAYGPATIQDFSSWSGIRVSEVKRALQSLGDKVTTVQVSTLPCLGPTFPISSKPSPFYLLARDLGELTDSSLKGNPLRNQDASINLLPSFDPFLLGHKDKAFLFDEEDYENDYGKVYRKAGWISPCMLLNGIVVGTWGYHRRGRLLEVGLQPFRYSQSLNLPKIRSGFEEEAKDVARFLGFQDIQVKWA